MIIADFCIARSRGMLRLMLEEHRPPASKQKREAEASLSSPIERLTWISPCRPSGTPARTPDRGLRPCRLPHGCRARYARGAGHDHGRHGRDRSEEHTSELQSLMRISYAVFCLKKKNYIQHMMIFSID